MSTAGWQPADSVQSWRERWHTDLQPVKQVGPDDCFPACVATILGVPLAEVPNFFFGPDNTEELARRWFGERCLAPLTLTFSGSLADLLMHSERLNPSIPFILGGTNLEGRQHWVVCVGGRIIHEPSPGFGPDDGGVVGPCQDGAYQVMYFVALPGIGRKAEMAKGT